MRASAQTEGPISTRNTLYCLVFSPCFGAIWGGIAGAVYGGFFFLVVGNLYGLVYGAIGGWLAGLVGVIINDRIGYRIGGVVGSLFCTLTILRPQSLSDFLTLRYGPIGVYNKISEFVVPIGIAFLLGWKVDKTSDTRPYHWLRELLAHSTLMEWSLGKRIVWACVAVFVHGFFVLRVLR